MSRPWRLAQSLDTLRGQINQLAPDRDKSSDGTIGDAAHASRKSDHNPDRNGVVRAFDLTHDPANGVDCRVLAEQLRESRDSRISYVIFDRRIFNSRVSPWEWRPYRGSNPHTKHMHISVASDRAQYDDTRLWDISLSEPSGRGGATPEWQRLRRGDDGAEVRVLQHQLGVLVDGIFGARTEAAVRAFQSARGLEADGIVGPYTWEALLDATPNAAGMENITATVFGGAGDPNRSAYDNHVITDDELGAALPWRFEGHRPLVRVMYKNGRSVICQIVDVGPWNTDDPYWQTGSRPQAESGTDRRGRKTNLAGIDLTPGAAEAIGLPGTGIVDWEFVGVPTDDDDDDDDDDKPSLSIMEQYLSKISAAIRPIMEDALMTRLPAPYDPNTLAALQEFMRQQKEGEPILSPIDKVFGGRTGWKTVTGVLGAIATYFGAKTTGAVDPGAVDPTGVLVELVVGAFGLLAGAGALAKVDRLLKMLGRGLELLKELRDRFDAAVDKRLAE